MTKTSKIVFVRNALQAALFNQILTHEITRAADGDKPAGRWATVRTKGHADAFQGAVAKVANTDKGDILGVNFAAPKLNYNFNDSNYVKDDVLAQMIEVATAANKGKPVAKKEIQFQLADLKEIIKASVKVPAEVAPPATPATPATPAVQEEVQA